MPSARYLKYREKILAYAREHREQVSATKLAYVKRHPERVKASKQKFEALKKEKNSLKRQQRYGGNKEQFIKNRRKEWHKAWVKNHPAEWRALCVRYRARKAGAAINDLTAQDWVDIQQHYGYRCVYCPPTCWRCQRHKHALTQDHVIPLSKGGNNTKSNVVPACQSCNSKKHDGEPLKPIQMLLL